MQPIHKGVRKFRHTPVCHSARDFAFLNTMFGFGQSKNPMKLVFDHHTITNKPHNIQIHAKNQTKLVGHYTAPRRKIIKVGGNLPLIAQFRVLCCPGLRTAQHSFLFLFPFPLFLPFLILFSSFLSPFLSSLPHFLSSLSLLLSSSFSFPPFLFSLPLPRTDPELSLASTNSPCEAPYIASKEPCMLTHGMPCVTHMACHVSHMDAFAMHGHTWLAMCTHMDFHVSPHGSPCVIYMDRHVSPDTRFLKIREIPTISEFNEIRLGS